MAHYCFLQFLPYLNSFRDLSRSEINCTIEVPFPLSDIKIYRIEKRVDYYQGTEKDEILVSDSKVDLVMMCKKA